MPEKTVQIPLSIFLQTIDFLENLDLRVPQPALFDTHRDILSAYLAKKQRMDLRKSYSGIIFAGNDDERWEARMDYLQKKRETQRWR
ncbi:MAG: hypothetical protein FWG94_05560 [Oscillospiraceae bacterium]|nr:hypothetical protein [Oscillospiraceae bacterium]